MATGFENRTVTTSGGVLLALRRHWLIVVGCVLLLVGAAVVIGLKRTPLFTANANVAIGPVFVNSPAGIASALQGTESLASVYSRLIDATAVIDDTDRRLAQQSLPGSGSGSVTATPIAESPLVRITAVAGSERQAIALVNARSAALATFVNRQGRAADEAGGISRRYRRAALEFRRRIAVRERLERRFENDPTPENQRAFDRAAAAADTALLHRDGLLTSYQTAVAGETTTPPLRVLARATTAGSDRYATLQVLVLLGLIGGLGAGAALAVVREQSGPRTGSH